MKKTICNRLAAALLCIITSSLTAIAQETAINIIPYPQSVTVQKGFFKSAGANFNCDLSIDSECQKAIQELADKITFISGKTCSYATSVGITPTIAKEKMKGFIFIKEASFGPEEYSIDINKSKCIVQANGHNGFLYAVMTLKQLMPAAIFDNEIDPAQAFLIPCVQIHDSPRFAYRGLLLDCARHFFPVEEIKKCLDLMAVYKLNRMHWHLTDDQGWRAEIKKYPRLTEVGAYRNGTMIAKDFESNDGKRYGGYYTQDQMRDVVAYAQARGITVIPEIDLPGHMVAALASYPNLGCSGGPYSVSTTWGVKDQVLCPGKEDMFEFLEDVFSELMEIFPSEYIHIGGDECPKTAWQSCPACQKRIQELGIKADGTHTAEQFLQNYVTARIQKFINAHGRKIIGWDEILEGNLEEGATVMSWRGVDGGIEASAKGFDVIMSPNTYCYINYYQSDDIANEPLAIEKILPIEKVYSYEPYDGLDASQQKHIFGVQGNLWGEFIDTASLLEYMMLPRMLALSEVQWCTPENKNYDRFINAFKSESAPILDILGYNYRKLDK